MEDEEEEKKKEKKKEKRNTKHHNNNCTEDNPQKEDHIVSTIIDSMTGTVHSVTRHPMVLLRTHGWERCIVRRDAF